MGNAIRAMVHEAMKEEREEIIREGRMQGAKEAMLRLLKKLTPDEILELGFTKEEIALAQDDTQEASGKDLAESFKEGIELLTDDFSVR